MTPFAITTIACVCFGGLLIVLHIRKRERLLEEELNAAQEEIAARWYRRAQQMPERIRRERHLAEIVEKNLNDSCIN